MIEAVGKDIAAAVDRFSQNLRLPMCCYAWLFVRVLALKNKPQSIVFCYVCF